ncbi:MAG: AraC family transcriptional regulator [Terriglobia bacterium]
MRRRATGRWPSDVREFAPEAPTAPPPLSATDNRIRRVVEVMEQEYSSRLTASRLAKVVGVSRSRFEHLFKAETGARFRPTLREIRLSKAQTLLAKPILSIKEVACRVGFLSTPAFSRAFVKRYGQPPSQWRRRQTEVRGSTFG